MWRDNRLDDYVTSGCHTNRVRQTCLDCHLSKDKAHVSNGQGPDGNVAADNTGLVTRRLSCQKALHDTSILVTNPSGTSDAVAGSVACLETPLIDLLVTFIRFLLEALILKTINWYSIAVRVIILARIRTPAR
ncbi:hypothetical protein E2C01_033882 [Portunus trituberculatus]|uniref:Uncharacterized protein n=1 Tax=Portunus trituberculatus TaxID=210409 RepID=A0A5B7F4N5_PORTR|nr:hypothetical protein [Portunus trituberculatus]